MLEVGSAGNPARLCLSTGVFDSARVMRREEHMKPVLIAEAPLTRRQEVRI
jgi:hypothetical protein